MTKEQVMANGVLLYFESEYKYIGVALFDNESDKKEFLTAWNEFTADFSKKWDWHEEHDEDYGEAWYDENNYTDEEFGELVEKHNGAFISFDWAEMDCAEI